MNEKTQQKEALAFNTPLILLAISFFLSILKLMLDTLKPLIEYSILSRTGTKSDKVEMLLDSAINGGLTLFILFVLLYFFLKKRSIFPKLFISALILNILYILYQSILIQSSLAITSAAGIFIGSALIVYFTRSKDIQKTFIK